MSWLGNIFFASPLVRDQVHGQVPAPTLQLPAHQDIEEWRAPCERVVPADIHVSGLLTMAYDSGLRGRARPKELVRLYAEMCWMNGYVPVSDKQILVELGARLRKTRPKVQTPDGKRQLTFYCLPDTDNIVAFKPKVRRKASQSALRSKERAVRQAIAA